MLRHFPQPLHTRGFEANGGVEAARHRVLDDGLLLLVQKRDQLFLGVDVVLGSAVDMVQESGDGGLLRKRWNDESY
jgi:hypothetical protein